MAQPFVSALLASHLAELARCGEEHGNAGLFWSEGTAWGRISRVLDDQTQKRGILNGANRYASEGSAPPRHFYSLYASPPRSVEEKLPAGATTLDAKHEDQAMHL
jgi:hypothetical protein